VLLISVLLAVPVSANGLSNATLTVGCGNVDHKNQVCITLAGDIEDVNQPERILTFDVFASSDLKTVVDEGKIDVKPNPAKGNEQAFTATLCFPKTATSSAASFVIELVAVTDKNGNAADFQLIAPNQTSKTFVDFDPGSKPIQVATSNTCVPPPPTPTPTATPVSTALAQTGGLDGRFPIAGLVLLGAGLGVFVVARRRERSRSAG
jgi:hypothetical protein